MQRRTLLGALAATATALSFGLAAGPAHAAWPERPIQMIVPWGAGGGTDAVARFLAAELEKDLKQPINVVNRSASTSFRRAKLRCGRRRQVRLRCGS